MYSCVDMMSVLHLSQFYERIAARSNVSSRYLNFCSHLHALMISHRTVVIATLMGVSSFVTVRYNLLLSLHYMR